MFDKKVRNIMISTIDRKRIFIFVAIAYSISIALALVVYWGGGIFISYPLRVRPQALLLMALLMFAPMVANIATRLITQEGWSNTLLRPNFRRGWRFYLAAWFLPILATIVGGVIYYLLFPGRFDMSMSWAREVGLSTVEEAEDPGIFFITRVAIALLLPVASLSLSRCFGEEFGWRAYLLPKLMPLGARKAVLLLGAIWGVFHWPAIFMGYEYGFGYWGAPVLGPLLFVVMACFQSAFLAWVTLRSGSVWPATLGHTVTNASGLLMLYFLNGEPDPLIGPMPVGIIGGLGYALLALLIFFSPRALIQHTPAPAEKVLAGARKTAEKAADQAKLGTVS